MAKTKTSAYGKQKQKIVPVRGYKKKDGIVLISDFGQRDDRLLVWTEPLKVNRMGDDPDRNRDPAIPKVLRREL